MQLFKSEWLQEPRCAFARGDARAPAFASRYGVRVERQPGVHRPPMCVVGVPDVETIEHERAVLRYLARYDRAA